MNHIFKVTGLIAVLLLLVPAKTTFAEDIRAMGGEIGNARYVPYQNIIGAFKTKYPEKWKLLDLGPSVSFTEQGVSHKKASIVNINSLDVPEVDSSNSLYYYVILRHTSQSIEPVNVDERKGFIVTDGNQTHIYVLRSSGSVFHIRYKYRMEAPTIKDVNTILQSLIF